jgi:hypothetical protein
MTKALAKATARSLLLPRRALGQRCRVPVINSSQDKPMNPMTPFEVRANNMMTAIQGVHGRVEEYGYTGDSAEECQSRVIGMFVTWLTACEEVRQPSNNGSPSFLRDVITKLPITDDPTWPAYIEPAPHSTLRQRAESLWGIRIAFTHADGDTNKISNPTNKQYAQSSPVFLPGVGLDSFGRLHLEPGLCHVAVRTVVQLRDVIP